VYQAVFYDYTTRNYHIRDDKKGWVEFRFDPTYFLRVDEYTEGAMPVLTGGYAIPTQKYDKENSNLLEKDINKELLILRELYYKYDDVIPSYHNVVFLDIEIKMGGALTSQYIKDAPMPITAIAFIDKNTRVKYCYVLDESGKLEDISEEDRKVIPCKNEKELILKFLDKWEELDPTIVTTWNGAFFDIPYMYHRFSRIVGIEQASRLSPLRKVFTNDRDETNPIRIVGVNHLDYMLLHKKYIMKEEPSYKLKDIGPKYAKLEKLEFEGNLNQLFEKDIHFYIDYNLRDVEILEGLEKTLKFIELTVLMSHICNIPYESIYHNTVMNEGAILKYLKRLGIVSPNKPTTHNPSRKGVEQIYAGGYIKPPNPGLYFDVIDLDFTSLYPSIIKSLNLGIETLVGRIRTVDNYTQDNSLEKLKERDYNEKIIVEKLDKKSYTLREAEITVGELIEIIEENEYTISASGVFFRTDERSIVAKILEGWFEKREHYRGLKKQSGKD
jgi:DNA polymerase elongation subunit (family B)